MAHFNQAIHDPHAWTSVRQGWNKKNVNGCYLTRAKAHIKYEVGDPRSALPDWDATVGKEKKKKRWEA